MSDNEEKNKVGRPLLFNSVEELQKKIEEYIKSCFTQKLDMFGGPIYIKDVQGKKTDKPVMIQSKPFTVTGLAVFLNTSRETLLNYEKKDGEFFDTIKKAKDIIYAYAEEFLYSGKNPAGAIFNLKNNWGWTDKQEIDHTSKGESIAPKVVSEIMPHVRTET